MSRQGDEEPMFKFKRVVRAPIRATDADLLFLRHNAALADAGILVPRTTGGFTEDHPDGSYGNVCTRRDLAGDL